MPRLPDAQDIRQVTDLNAPRVVFPDSGAGRGLMALSKGVGQLGAAFEARDRATTANEIAAADAEYERLNRERRHSFDTDTDHETYEPRYKAGETQDIDRLSQGISNPEAREKWRTLTGTKSVRNYEPVYRRGYKLATERDALDLKNNLEAYEGVGLEPGVTPERIQQSLGDMRGQIDAIGMRGRIPPTKLEEEYDRRKSGIIASYYNTRLKSAQTPEEQRALAEEFGFLPRSGATVGNITEEQSAHVAAEVDKWSKLAKTRGTWRDRNAVSAVDSMSKSLGMKREEFLANPAMVAATIGRMVGKTDEQAELEAKSFLDRAEKNGGGIEGVLKTIPQYDELVKGAKSNTILRAPSPADRARIRREGGIVINLDTNWAKSGQQTSPMVVIPDNASREQRDAATAYAQRISEVYKEKFGQSLSPKVVTRSQNGRGRNDTIHTEPYSVNDDKAVEFFDSPEGRQVHAAILRDTFGKVPGAQFSIPHDPDGKGDMGARGRSKSEVDLARGVLEVLGQGVGVSGAVKKEDVDKIASKLGFVSPFKIDETDDASGGAMSPAGEQQAAKDADEFIYRQPMNGLLQNLSPAKYRALAHNVRIALSSTLQAQIRDENAMIESGRGDEVQRDQLGRTALDRAAGIVQSSRLDSLRSERERVSLIGKYSKDLPNLSQDEGNKVINDLLSGPQSGHANAKAAAAKLSAQWKKIEDARRKDPGGSVDQHPIMENFRTQVRESGAVALSIGPDGQIQQDSTTYFFDETGRPRFDVKAPDFNPAKAQEIASGYVKAKLEAQEVLGILKPRAISRDDAVRLLGMDRTPDSTEELRGKLKDAANRAFMVYGEETGRRVFKDAVELIVRGGGDEGKEARSRAERTLSSAAREYEAGLLARFAMGDNVSNMDIRRAEGLNHLARTSGFLGELSPTNEPAIMEGARMAAQMPTERHVAALKDVLSKSTPENRQKAIRAFDAKFGVGSASKIMEGAQ